MSAKVIPTVSRLLQEYMLMPRQLPKGLGVDDVNIYAPLVRHAKGGNPAIRLNAPVLGAAMQSVTGVEMAKALASEGGLGIVYCSQPPSEEAAMVKAVKDYKAGFVVPDVFAPDASIADVIARTRERGYSTFPITHDGSSGGRLVGLITKNDFYPPKHSGLKVADRMVPAAGLRTARLADILDSGQPNLKRANELLVDSHHASLPIVDDDGSLVYMIFRKDVDAKLESPNELLDRKRRLMCGAAVNTRDYKERSKLLHEAEVDLFCIDTSQGYSDYAKDCLKYLKRNYDAPVVAGNVVTRAGFRFLADAGADAVKVGMGSGSICITQEQIRVGRGPATAIAEVAAERGRLLKADGTYVPVIADGGIGTFGDITVALALGADAVMLGKLLAGASESPTNEIIRRVGAGEERVKPYWGEGSARAREWSKMRYGHSAFEEGFETYVPAVGPLSQYLRRGMTMVKDGIRKAGCRSMPDLHRNAELEYVSSVMLSVSKDKQANVR